MYEDGFSSVFRENFPEKLRFDAIGDEEVESVRQRGDMDFVNLTKLAVDYSDGVIQSSENIDERIAQYIKDKNVEFLEYTPDFKEMVEKTDAFYDKIDQ